MNTKFLAEGGLPITAEIAMEIRQLVFGTAAIPMRAEWTQTPFIFGAAKEELAYGLRSPRNATRGLLSVVQGFILKYLLFSRRVSRSNTNQDILRATADLQTDALVTAMVEILRIISDKGKVTVVLPTTEDEVFVQHSATYFHDSITEKFTEEGSPGTLLFLYSAVLTRSLGKVRTDLDSTKGTPLTMSNNEEGSLMIVTLLLTGRATPYIHNGVINVGDENNYATPQYGILNRCTVGLLLWDNESGQSLTIAAARQPGSRLKTPNCPIWITSCTGHFGVTFNRNPELLRNYHAESCFDLVYYSCSGHQIIMTIDNRTYNEKACGMLERQVSTVENTSLSARPNKDEQQSTSATGGTMSGGSSGNLAGSSAGDMGVGAKEESAVNTPLQRLIHTKWEEAHIRFHMQPSMLSYLFSTTQ